MEKISSESRICESVDGEGLYLKLYLEISWKKGFRRQWARPNDFLKFI